MLALWMYFWSEPDWTGASGASTAKPKTKHVLLHT